MMSLFVLFRYYVTIGNVSFYPPPTPLPAPQSQSETEELRGQLQEMNRKKHHGKEKPERKLVRPPTTRDHSLLQEKHFRHKRERYIRLYYDMVSQRR